MTGRLVLVATPLGNMGDLSARAVATLADADLVACEDTRRTGLLLKRAGVTARRLLAVHEHNEASMIDPVLERIRAGETVAVVTDAGMPGISDPGCRLVQAAAAAGLEVTVVPGPSAAVAALAVSGMATERWVFEGFLPRKGRARAARLDDVAVEQRTVVLYEAPHRLTETLDDLREACGPARRVALVRELTKLHEEIWRGALGEATGEGARGEYVIVLEGAAAPEGADDAAIEAALAAHPNFATARRSAVADVAEALGVARNRVYTASRRMP